MNNPIALVEPIIRRIPRVPAWVIVLGLSAFVGSISAVVSVTALARVRNNRPAIEVPVTEQNTTAIRENKT